MAGTIWIHRRVRDELETSWERVLPKNPSQLIVVRDDNEIIGDGMSQTPRSIGREMLETKRIGRY